MLYEDYIEWRNINLNPNHHSQKRSYSGDELIVGYLKKQIENLRFLTKYIKNDFQQVCCCNNFFRLLEKNKLALILAYQIMIQEKKQSNKHTLTYLKKYIEKNKYNLIINYGFEKTTNQKGNYFSVYVIYEYIQRKLN